MGYARVNAVSVSGSGEGGIGVTTTPTVLKSIKATAGNGKITVSWTYNSTGYMKGIRVSWSTGGYPATATDGYSHHDIDGTTTTSYTIEGLNNNTVYYIRLYPYNSDGNFQTSITNAQVTATPTDIQVASAGATVKTGISGSHGYALITSSGDFTITASGVANITAILVGGGQNGGEATSANGQYTSISKGGTGGIGGYYSTASIQTINGTLTDTATIGAGNSYAGTVLVHNGTSYPCSRGGPKTGGAGAHYYSSKDEETINTDAVNGTNGYTTMYQIAPGIDSKIVCVGSSGGGGANVNYSTGASGGIGAGAGASTTNYGGIAANIAGGDASFYGCGGGGGASIAAASGAPCGAGGAGYQGCIFLYWQL